MAFLLKTSSFVLILATLSTVNARFSVVRTPEDLLGVPEAQWTPITPTPSAKSNAIEVVVTSLGKPASIRGWLGMSLPAAVGPYKDDCDKEHADVCYHYGDFAKVLITNLQTEGCTRVEWRSSFARRLEDCFDIEQGVHWYGGGGPTYVDTWPIETEVRPEVPFVNGDSLGGYEYGGVTENFWVVSSGIVIHVDDNVPLWFSVNSTRPNQICFVAQDRYPFKPRNEGLSLSYDICHGSETENFKDVYLRARNRYYAKPTDIPDERMLVYPFWSTWAEYKEAINETLVIELAERLLAEGFSASSHVEIDDFWETCYGDADFNEKFPTPAAMTARLRELGFRSTVWTHPFINYNCPSYEEAFRAGYFVKDEKGMSGMTRWWQGATSGVIDYANPEAVTWWRARLERIRTEYGVDSFKFDAGEVSWLPHSYQMNGDPNLQPNLATTKWVEACAVFGKLIEVRVGRLTQEYPIFVRMLDKDSRWGYDNGLRSMIPTLLDFGLKGYPFILPDMIGGNAYGEMPSKELYIRWMQVNIFMPSVQFSLLPWNYDKETVDIVKQVLAYREQYADLILRVARETTQTGVAINLPMWFADPTDVNTYTIDDQYMLGDAIIVAPVLVEGATSRDIYLPVGKWTYATATGPVDYQGPTMLKDFPAPLNTVPFFVKASVYNARSVENSILD